MASKGLGKGLDLMIPNAMGKKETPVAKETEAKSGQDFVVKITKVEPNRNQPRKHFNEKALEELADSIKQHGVLQPILVEDKKTYYEIISGERRWRASKMAGLKEVPVRIVNFSEEEKAIVSIIENIQRADLNPIEEALGYKDLISKYNMKQEEVAAQVSKSRATITNALRLLKLCDEVQQMIIDDKLTTGHARALIVVENHDKQLELANKIVAEKLSVRDVEKLIKNLNSEKKAKKEPKKIDPSMEIIYHDLEEKLKGSLGTKVSISAKENGSGKIEIEFFSHDELDRIMDAITK